MKETKIMNSGSQMAKAPNIQKGAKGGGKVLKGKNLGR